MKQHTKGFAALEVIMGIAIVVLFTAVVYFAYQAGLNKNSQTNQATVSPSPSSSSSAADEQSRALAQVKGFYQKWVAEDVVNDPSKYPTSQWLKDGFVTQQAVDQESKYPQVDLATCSQNPLKYEEYTFATPNISGSTGTVNITGTYPGTSGSSSQPVRFGLGLTKDGLIWKINSFNCPNLKQ